MELSKIILRIVLIIVFLTLIALAVWLFLGNHSCSLKALRGDGNIIRRDLPVEASFTRIRVTGSMNVYIRQDSTASIVLQADSNLVEYIQTEFDDETLVIKHKPRLHLSSHVKLLISVKDLKEIEVEGAGGIYIPDTFRTEQFTLDISGAGLAEMTLQCQHLKTRISGAGEIRLKGSAVRATSTINGAGKLLGQDFPVNEQEILVNGAGSAYISAVETLKATINGAGLIEYTGNPLLTQKISGVGKIRQTGT